MGRNRIDKRYPRKIQIEIIKSSNLESAIKNTYNSIDNIKFDNMYFRKDIGKKGLDYISDLSLEDNRD